MNIGRRIKERRKMLKMSADELGQRLGKNRATIYRYENGEIENLPLDILEPIADALETTPAYLMGWEYEEEPEELADIAAQVLLDKGLKKMVEQYIGLSESDQFAARMFMESLSGKTKKD